MTARRAEGEEEDLHEQENPRGFPDGPTGEAKDLGSIPGLGQSPGEGNGNPLQYPCLENPMDENFPQCIQTHQIFRNRKMI